MSTWYDYYVNDFNRTGYETGLIPSLSPKTLTWDISNVYVDNITLTGNITSFNTSTIDITLNNNKSKLFYKN